MGKGKRLKMQRKMLTNQRPGFRTPPKQPGQPSFRAGMSWDQVRQTVDQICETRGWYHGCPLPSATVDNQRLVIAKGAPLADKMVRGSFGFNEDHPEEPVTIDKDNRIVNRWVRDTDEITLFRDAGVLRKIRMPIAATERLKFWIDTMVVRSGVVTVETEMVAMESLREKLSEWQWRSYVVSGMFCETSERSGVTYIIRKGLPTIAISEKPFPDGTRRRKFLCCLCLHPMAYYVDTWAGSQPPSDEVIAHLMLIRADEHFFWRKSGQHSITDPRACV